MQPGPDWESANGERWPNAGVAAGCRASPDASASGAAVRRSFLRDSRMPHSACSACRSCVASARSPPAKEPAKKPPTPGRRREEQLEGLGFSIGPEEGGKARTSLFGWSARATSSSTSSTAPAAWAATAENRCGPSRPSWSAASNRSTPSISSRSSSTTSGPWCSIRPARPAGWPSPPTRTSSGRSVFSTRSPPAAARTTRPPSGWPSASSPT